MESVSLWVSNRGSPYTVHVILIAGKLYEGTEYYFRVAAENAVGISDFIELTTAVVPKPPYSEYLPFCSLKPLSEMARSCDVLFCVQRFCANWHLSVQTQDQVAL